MEKEFNVLVQAIDKAIQVGGVFNRNEIVYLNDVMAKIDVNFKKEEQEEEPKPNE